MEEGITIKRQTDELTGLSNISVMDQGSARLPGRICVRLLLWWMEGKELCLANTNASTLLPTANASVSLMTVSDRISGDIIARIPQEVSQNS